MTSPEKPVSKAHIYALHASCRCLRWLVGYLTESPSLLNVNKQLERYVKDPLGFRNQLGENDALIAGDFVRNFLEFRSSNSIPLLHVYVQDGLKRRAFVDYLYQYEGYRAKSEQSSVSGRPAALERPSFPDVNIIVKATSGPPIIEIINSAMMTLDLCFMSWNKAYSLLPLLTIAKHKFYLLKPLNNELGEVLNRLSQYGWTTRDMLWSDLTTELIPRKQCHQIGGPSSLVIKLGGASPSRCTPEYVLDGSVFAAVWDFDNNSTRRLSVKAEPLKTSFALRYVHTNGVKGSACKDWREYLEDRLERWVYVELAKLGREDRPPGFYFNAPGNYHVSIPSTWRPTEGMAWDYADDQVTTCFQEWDQYQGRYATSFAQDIIGDVRH